MNINMREELPDDGSLPHLPYALSKVATPSQGGPLHRLHSSASLKKKSVRARPYFPLRGSQIDH